MILGLMTRGRICVCGVTRLDVMEWNAILYKGEAWHSLANNVGMLAKNYGIGRCVQRQGLKDWAGFRGDDFELGSRRKIGGVVEVEWG
jgi:hypothetical protein